MMTEQATRADLADVGAKGALRVFYDGDCPMCRREIAFIDARALPGSLDLIDISESSGHGKDKGETGVLPPGLDRKTALALMHVQLPDGRVVKGAEAFAAIWERVPRAALLARMAARWPLRPLLDLAYRAFLLLRPGLQALVRRAERRARLRRSPGKPI